MNSCEYLKRAFDLYNSGKIDDDTYDAMIMNVVAFCDDDDCEDESIRR